VAVVEYLIGLGADPNKVTEGADTALRSALWSLEWQLDLYPSERYSPQRGDPLQAVDRLLRLGARFHPDESDELHFLKRCLLKLDWWNGYQLMKSIWENEALGEGHVLKLFKDRRLRSRLKKRLPALARMFPALKKLVG